MKQCLNYYRGNYGYQDCVSITSCVMYASYEPFGT